MIWKSHPSGMGSSPPAFLFVLLVLFFTFMQSGCATTPRYTTTTPSPPPPPPQTAQIPPAEPAEASQDDDDFDPGLPVTAPLKAPKIVIKKAKKRLFLYSFIRSKSSFAGKALSSSSDRGPIFSYTGF